MDYEKKYKEALERARALRNEAIEKEYAVDYIKDYETIFPELAESEDERIRKFLINWIRDNGVDTFHYIENSWIDKILAWLEKQKEQKPDSLIYDKDLDKAAREFYLTGGADSPVDSTGLVPIVRMAEFGATWMKERMEKEPKPAEWSEYDKKMFEEIMKILPADESIKRWFISHYSTQPIQERSEEDEKMVKAIEYILYENYTDAAVIKGVEIAEIVTWLESLRPPQYCEKCKLKKSVQCWKPSEEQMYSLGSVVKGAGECSVGSVGYNLASLYNDLKKLM